MSTIFLSYCWDNREIADIIDQAFQPTGITMQRDVRTLKYKDSIKEYMQKIRTVDYALLLLSDEFLKSANCMYEVIEVLKEKDFRDKILPVFISGTKMFKPEDKIDYIRYWSHQHDTLQQTLEGLEVTAAIELYQDLKHFKNIHNSISEFFSIISDMNLTSVEHLIEQKFKPIFDHIGVSDKILIDRILSLKDVKDKEDREIDLDQLETDYPNNSRVLFVKASYSYQGKEYKKAARYYQKAIESDPNFSPSYYNLGYLVDTYGNDPNEAAELYSKAIKLDPQNIRAMNNLARLYSLELGEYLMARTWYERSLELAPEDAISLHNLAILLHHRFEEHDLAASLFKKSIKIDPNAGNLYGYGLLLWKHFNLINDAVEQMNAALEFEPEDKKILKSIGNIYSRDLGQPALAKRYFDRFIKLKPSAEDHHMYYIFLLAEEFQGQYKTLAAKHYQIAARLNDQYRAKIMDEYLNVNW